MKSVWSILVTSYVVLVFRLQCISAFHDIIEHHNSSERRFIFPRRETRRLGCRIAWSRDAISYRLSLTVTCLFTTFLCTWAVIHPRVTRDPSRRLLHKFALFLKTVIAPEFIAVEGLQEWSQARKTVKQCERLTDGELELVQAFYIGMLALRYRTENGERVIWPNQYQWLLEQHLVDWKDHYSRELSKENIRDKSNADGTVKLFALLQVSWFVVQSIMRAVHNLPLSQLETMTLSYVPLFIVTYYFWWAKPKDVFTPSIVALPEMSNEQRTTFENLSVDSTFDDENTEQQVSWWNIWKLTPRVFEKEARERALQESAQGKVPDANQEEKPAIQEVGEQMVPAAAVVTERLSLKKAATEKLPARSPPTEVKPILRKTVTDNTHIWEDSRQSPIQPILTTSSTQTTFAESAIRRSTIDVRIKHTIGPTKSSQETAHNVQPHRSEIVLGYWDPYVYHSKIWPVTCLFGASFGALHLISWDTPFPSLVEAWLWRIAAIASIVSMLIFMQYEKVVLRWGGPLTLLSIISPVMYLMSRIVMIAGVIAAFRGMDPRIYETYVVSTYWVHVV